MTLYLNWLHQIDPNAQPNFYGVFSWSAARLFVEEAQALGGKLTRQSLIAKTRTVKNWTGNGIHSVQHPGHRRDRGVLAGDPAGRRGLARGVRKQVHVQGPDRLRRQMTAAADRPLACYWNTF